MIPSIAIVGRPNVGKSTLFNCLTQSRDALVADQPGLTRDRKYGEGQYDDRKFIVIDTGGIDNHVEGIEQLMTGQVWLAVEEADVILFLVDGKSGIHPDDHDIIKKLRQFTKPIQLVVNKVDGADPDVAMGDFFQLGVKSMAGISASHRRGINQLMEFISGALPELAEEPQEDDELGIRIAIVGKPNVGKSTLVNRILGEDRVLAFDMPGTTRDSITVPFVKNDTRYTLIDTAGIRRKKSVSDKIEKFSIIKAIQAVDASQVVILVIDAQQGITDQDSRLMGFIIETGRALIIAVNKWDGLSDYDRSQVKVTIHRKFSFVQFADIHFISALHGSGVGLLLNAVNKAYYAATRDLKTPELTRVLIDAVDAHAPPLIRGRRVKLRYAHQGGKNPPVIVIHGNQTEKINTDYRRYLINCFRDVFKLKGTPIRLEFKSSSNPYKGKVNKLSESQISKKQRVRTLSRKKRHR
ncbi:MAG: ribosome biogenesis GTPase Der [Thiohalomonadales bacterium]